jgi:hypothetical protein
LLAIHLATNNLNPKILKLTGKIKSIKLYESPEKESSIRNDEFEL